MATERLSISMPSEVRARIREYAAAAGLDVSTYLVIAAQAQMDEQDRIRRVFETFEGARVDAEVRAAPEVWPGDEIELTAEEQSEVDAILGRTRPGEAAA
ncbi:hypothetical protein [Streptomyces sp. NRRL S-87]|uniref:hypothetical protein n=1 Tax=Streptomyces sp. NRRL S-87 TaxID=1463920 RepID=UPI0004BF009E|nr:hypothetical protein [Streptomyces sp. NRRL S-87]